MKKILNWTFGACFRTLGKILAIFLVGALLFILGSKIGFRFPEFDWLTLRVNASEINYPTNWASTLPQLERVDFKSCSGENSCSTLMDSYQDYISVDYNSTYKTFYTNTDSFSVGENGYVIETYSNLKTGYLYEVNYYICSNKNIRTSNVSVYGTYWGNGYDMGNTYTRSFRTDLGGYPGDGEDGRSWSYCSLFGGFIVPDQEYAWTAIRFQRDSTLSGVYMSVISFEVKELGLYSESMKDIIEETISSGGLATAESVEEVNTAVAEVQEEVTELNNELKETNDTIKDSDITGAEDSASGFFDSFTSNDFGLSSIVSAPLRGINAMLNDSCVAPSATYKGQTFSLPCGSLLWSRPGGDEFRNFINVMYGGFLAYFVIRKMFLDVEKLKNPDSDKVEVDKL